jgi:type VI secretion system protein ImpG
MNREFLELYNRELRLLYENAKEFAEEFPGVAERLGGLTADSMDPMISGLLEGSAFLAARVQLKLKHEFSEFTYNLLEQLVPHYLAPTPSAALIRADPPYAEPNLKDGLKINAGAYLEARYIERERRVACRFRLAGGIVLWPFEIAHAEFFPAPAPLQALGLETGPDIMAGMQISLIRRSMAKPEDEPDDRQAALKPDIWISKCRIDDLPVHVVCNEADAVRIYEKLLAHCRGIYFRYLNEFGDPVLVKAPPNCLRQIGFHAGEELLPNDKRIFHGFDFLRDLFILPSKFLGFRLTKLAGVVPKIQSRKMDVIFTFDRSDARLASAVRPSAFSLYTAPTVNLFELTAGRAPVKSNEYEYQIVPDRSRYLDYEAHRVLKVFAHFAGSSDKVEVYPLYSAPPPNVPEESALFYTIRRVPRRRTVEERRYGRASNYTGTDMFISLANQGGTEDHPPIAELSVRALCSNRHLTEHLPTGQGGADFILEDNTTLPLNCVIGPTMPAESIVGKALGGDGVLPSGTAAWRLISMLSLNHLGLTGRGAENSAEALRELLSLFANTSDSATERRIRGILSVESRPIVRRIRQANGTGTARGLEITVTFDEKAFEGSGIFLYGAVLDRFFAEYVPVNNLVQTVIKSSDRGEVVRWPPRLGTRVEL